MAIRFLSQHITSNSLINNKTNQIYDVIKPKELLSPEEIENILKAIKELENGEGISIDEFFEEIEINELGDPLDNDKDKDKS